MKQKSLQIKITIGAGLCLLITAGIIIFYSAVAMRESALVAREEAIDAAKQYAGAVAKQYANHIRAEFDVALEAAHSIAAMLRGVRDHEIGLELSREEANGILKSVLTQNPKFVGVYTAWEPDAFDRMDRGYISDKGHDETGRFIPYWNLGEDGNIRLEALMDYEKEGIGDYYLIPRNTKKEAIIDPYVYPIQEKPTMLISLVMPIVVDDIFYGIAGVDLRANALQDAVDNVDKIYDGSAKILIVSHNGTIAAATGMPDMMGKHIRDIHSECAETDMKMLRDGKEFIEIMKNNLSLFTPLKIGETGTPWSVNVLIPLEKITAAADTQSEQAARDISEMIGIGLFCTIAALGFLWLGVRRIIRPVHQIIRTLSVIAEQVTFASDKVSSVSQMVSSDASEQRLSIKETSSCLDEMASVIRKNAENTGMANQLVQETAQTIAQADVAMDDLTGAMKEISEASDEISRIIKVIDEIAFQTNLLSLNAAVEAARAGQAGAGFAVVAGEVRNLAVRSAEAAKNTTNLIRETVRQVKAGETFLTRANELFFMVSESRGKVEKLMEEINTSSQEQAWGTDQVNIAVTEMNNVTQRNMSDSEESASASEELNAQAEEMKEQVERLIRIVGE